MKTILQILIICVLCTSCFSEMCVKVEVANRDLLKEAALKELNPNIKATIDNIDEFIGNRKTLEDEIANFYIEVYKNTLLPSETGDYEFFKTDIVNTFETKYGDKYGIIIQLNNKLKEEYKRQELVIAYNTISQIELRISEITTDLANYDLRKNTKLSAIFKKKISEIPFFDKVNETTKSIKEESERLRFHLLGDPMVSFVAKDNNKDLWKSCFNKTFSRNFFGNSDIAVILRKNPSKNEEKSGDYNNNFTIKGVRLDSDEAVKATFNVMSQAVNMIATVYGAPKFSSSNSSTNPLPEIPDNIVKFDNTEDDYHISEKKLENYKKLLIKLIENENINPKSGEDLKNSITKIKTQWNIIKTELNK